MLNLRFAEKSLQGAVVPEKTEDLVQLMNAIVKKNVNAKEGGSEEVALPAGYSSPEVPTDPNLQYFADEKVPYPQTAPNVPYTATDAAYDAESRVQKSPMPNSFQDAQSDEGILF